MSVNFEMNNSSGSLLQSLPAQLRHFSSDIVIPEPLFFTLSLLWVVFTTCLFAIVVPTFIQQLATLQNDEEQSSLSCRLSRHVDQQHGFHLCLRPLRVLLHLPLHEASKKWRKTWMVSPWKPGDRVWGDSAGVPAVNRSLTDARLRGWSRSFRKYNGNVRAAWIFPRLP